MRGFIANPLVLFFAACCLIFNFKNSLAQPNIKGPLAQPSVKPPSVRPNVKSPLIPPGVQQPAHPNFTNSFAPPNKKLYNQSLCYLKREFLKSYYDYEKSIFSLNYESGSYYPLIKTINSGFPFFNNQGKFELVGMESKINPAAQTNSLAEWYEYIPPKGQNKLASICRPNLNKGRCLFKAAYEGDFKIEYQKGINAHSIHFGENVKASIYSNKRLLKFPDNCGKK